MPYASNVDLPDSVTNNLPHHAQDIYKATFNSAFEEYKKPSNRRTSETREQVSHKVAWAAVKQKYRKKDDKWVEKSKTP
ncbi:MAG: ChaB family protein [Alphaproteobacteria bacterium]|nr:ChaB family protein [Alphaproteobacteria bacterium]